MPALLTLIITVARAQSDEPFSVRISFGHTDAAGEMWNGAVLPEGASIFQIEEWHFLGGDRVSLNRFRFRAGDGVPKGLILKGVSGAQGRISVTTDRGNFSFALSDLQLNQEASFLEGNARVERLLDAVKLTDDSRDDDYPSIAAVDGTSAWAVWQSYSGRFDEVRISKYQEGEWKTFTRVPNVSGDVWKPQVALDAQKRPWVIWSQQVDGNFDLYARALNEKGNRWLQPVRLSSHPYPDIDHHVAGDTEGRLWVVWQGFRGRQSDIFLRVYEGKGWSEQLRVTDHPANDWEPKVAVDSGGAAWIVWDSYRNGNYDVYMRRYKDGKFDPEIAVADSPRFEAHASVTVDAGGRVWVAWDESGLNWAKDTGPTIDPNWRGGEGQGNRGPGIRIYESRNLNLAVFEEGARKVPLKHAQSAAERGGGNAHDAPQLLSDPASGRIALVYHRRDMTEPRGRNRRSQGFWETAVLFYNGEGWQKPLIMPHSAGRSSARPDASFAPDGSLWMICPTDGRQWTNMHRPIVTNVYTARFAPPGPAQQALLRSPDPAPADPEHAAIRVVHPNEAADVAAIRSYRTFVNGTERRIVRGDFHRHTELSWDGGGRTDGSLIDFYRYMLDAAAMDFGAVTDHNAGGDYEYWWWLTEKSCDLYSLPRYFTTFYGYERSARFPHGHRNVFHTRRGVPVISFFTEPAFGGSRPGVGAANLLEDDTKLLYETLHRTGGIAISHTSTSNTMGTDWRDNDPLVEPVVEIFQGARVSNEHLGAPRAARGPEDRPPGGFQEAGFLWNAYAKGYRLGTITSSDHNSTHISYAMVYTEQPDREAVFEGIRKRHTYGATDNIILDYRMGDHFMGEEFTTSSLPPIKLKVIGTSTVAAIDIIKNAQLIYTTAPRKQEVTLLYLDQDATPGTSYYYVRVLQDDRQIAWSSPIWVHYQK